MKNTVLILLVGFLCSCGDKANSQSNAKSKKVDYENHINTEYWNDGKAEIATYELIQNRYNSLHPGKLVMVFVTEDFLTEKQVKNERYTSDNSTKILKNIRIRKFTTGIYDYSLHTSVFTPLDLNQFNTLKVTNSMQEWCGTTFRQLNNRKENYELQVRSYFEGEGDNDYKLAEVILEDELFNRLRINPTLLPQGEFEVIPSLSFLSLRHNEPKVEMASGKIETYSGTEFVGNDLMIYSYSIESQKRTVKIIYEKAMPHRIIGFTEAYPSAFDGKVRTSIAKLKEAKRLKYWGLNNLEDAKMRESLGL